MSAARLVEHRANEMVVIVTGAQKRTAVEQAAALGISVQAWMRMKLFNEVPDTRDGRTRRRSAGSDE